MKPIRDTTISRRHHERNNAYTHNPTKRVRIRQKTVINKQHKSRISSSTRALKMTRREKAENCDNKQRTEYEEISTTFKQKAKEDTGKYNQEVMRETIKKPEESPKNAEARPRKTDHNPGQAG